MHSSFALIILVSSLFTMAAAVRPVPPDSKISLDGHTHFMPTDKSLDTNPVVRSPGVNSGGSTASCSNIPGRDGLGHFMLPERSLGYNSILRSPGISGSTASRSFVESPGGNAISSPGFILHKRSLAEIPDMLAAGCLPSPLLPSAYVIEMEPPSKPSPPTCLPRC